MSLSFPYLLQCNELENMTCTVLSCLQGNILPAESQDTLLWMCRITQRTRVHGWCDSSPTKQCAGHKQYENCDESQKGFVTSPLVIPFVVGKEMKSGTATPMSAKHWEIMSGICLL